MSAARFIFYACLVRPLAHICLGFNVRNQHRLPGTGPAIITPNHNSHLDALVVASLLPLRAAHKIRPVVAADYFFRTPLRVWLSRTFLGAIPLKRGKPAKGTNPFAEVEAALRADDILILFPEGSRGDPEEFGSLKSGIVHLLKRAPETPVIPIYMHGLGKVLPRGEALLVPFFCDVFVGAPLLWNNDRNQFMNNLEASLKSLEVNAAPKPWE